MPIYRSKTTGQFVVEDDNGNPLPEAQIHKNAKDGLFYATDKDGNMLFDGGFAGGPVISNERFGKRVILTAPAINSGPQTIGQNSFMDQVHSGMDEYVRPFLPMLVQSGVDLASANPATGIAASAATRSLLDYAAGNHQDTGLDISAVNSNPIGQLGNNLLEGTVNAAFNRFAPFAKSFGNKLGNKIGNVSENAVEGLVRKGFPINSTILPEDVAAINASPRSVGQVSGSTFARNLEQRFGGEKATQLANWQRGQQQTQLERIQRLFFPNGTPSDVNAVTQKKLAENYFAGQEGVDKLYNDFRTNHAEKNVWMGSVEKPNPNYDPNAPVPQNAQQWQAQQGSNPKTIQEPVQIKGPIVLARTNKLAEEVRPKLEAFLGSEDFQNLPDDYSKSKFKQLMTAIDGLTQKTSVTPSGTTTPLVMPVKEWEAVKNWRTIIGQSLSTESKLNLPKGTLLALKNAAGEDIDNSIKLFWGNGQGASDALNAANKIHGEFSDTFDKSMRSKLFKGTPNLSKNGENLADPSTLYNKIGQSPEIAQQFKAALGSGNQDIAKGSIVSKLFENATDVATGKFSADSVINALESPGYKELFTASERSNLTNFMRSLRTMKPEDLANNSRALGFKGNMFHMSIPAVTLASSILTGHPVSGAIGAGIEQGLLEIGPRQFVQRVLLNPKYARMVANLPYQQAGTPSANMLGKAMLGAFRGTQLILNYGEVKIPVNVTEDGKLEPVK